MAAGRYTSKQLSADLARFGFASADDLTRRGLARRYRNRLDRVGPGQPDASTAAARELDAAHERLKAWDEQGRPALAQQEAAAERTRQERDEQEQARRALARVFFWRRWRRRAMLPLRGAWWAFAHLPIERLPWVAGGVAFVLLWPFVQDSRIGPYVPHVPSVYAWLNNTDAVRYLRGERVRVW